MHELPRPPREEQALREVGTTEVRSAAARWAALGFLATIAVVPAAQIVEQARDPDRRWFDPWPELAAGAARAAGRAGQGALLAANRELLAALDRFDERLEEESVIQRALLPWGQWALTRLGGVGNEQAYLGREAWLFYRPDVDQVTGPGFLEPRVLTKRALGGEAWEERPQPDPLPALVGFARDLEARGIELVVLPVPGKASIHPERLSRRAGTGAAALRNPSWETFVRRLDAERIDVLDLGPLLFRVGNGGSPAYLATDTHWAPGAMEAVAEALATHLDPSLAREGARPQVATWARREAAVEGRGDIAAMLRLPPSRELYPREHVLTHPVLDAAGRLWRPERGAPVLLLGDSFTNVYSDPALGWGSGAGLGEQVAYFLGGPVDRIAQNAGGAYTTRQELARQLAADPERLDRVRVVVYQFAERELSFGDWKAIELPETTKQISTPPPAVLPSSGPE
jgi:alginate O-acetyltransferase complex protein AlgJ